MDEIFIEEKINFEDGWPWWFKLTDENYPGAYQWKLNRGYTSSVGTGPKADRTTQSVCKYFYNLLSQNDFLSLRWYLCIL